MLEELSRTENADEFRQGREALEPEILKTHDAVLLWRLGQIYRQRQMWPDSERVLRESVKWGPSAPEPYRDLGLLYMRRDDLSEEISLTQALEMLEKGLKIEKINNDLSAVTHTLLASVLEWSNEPKRAEEELRKALEIDPHYEEAQYNLAMLLDDSRKEEKLRLLRQSIAEDPDYFVALRDLGFELVKDKQLAGAEGYLNKALGLDASDVSLRWYLGQLKWMQHDLPSAELHFRTAVELDPCIGKSRELLGRFLQHTDRVEEANRELFSAIELDPNNEDSFSAYVKFLGEFEDRDFATGLYTAAKKNTLVPQQRLVELERRLLAQERKPWPNA
jgi:tetratricopeptide (TPR) repeat protein